MEETTHVSEFMMPLLDLAEYLNLTGQGLHQYCRKNNINIAVSSKKSFLSPEDVRKLLLLRGFNYQRKTLSFQMLKGGCCKTTSALNVGIRANMLGARVLLIDLDLQGNLSFALNVESPDDKVWVDIVEGKATIHEVIKEITPTLHLVPSNLNNSTLEKVLSTGKKNLALAMRQHLKQVEDNYDFILIDTAPSLSAVNTAAACASDVVILPVTPDKFSFSGLSKTLDDLRQVRSEFNAKFESKILFTKFDARETASRELLKLCMTEHDDDMLKSYVRVSSDIKNTVKSGRTIYSKKSSAKEDYDLVTRELMDMGF